MRITTTGAIRRIDLSPALDLIDPLLAEWARLEFDAEGRAVNPTTNQPSPVLALIEGRHREPGTRYSVSIEIPAPPPSDPTSDLVGPGKIAIDLRIDQDDHRRLAVTVTEDRQRWSTEVQVAHGRLPRVDLAARLDLTALWRAEGAPGCIARFFGGRGELRATFDLTALDRQGRVVDLDGRANRFHMQAQVDLQTSSSTWDIEASGTLRARGLGRLVLLFGGRSLRRLIDGTIQGFWAEADKEVDRLDADLREMARAVQQTGGPAAFVHRALWDPGFDLRSPSAR